MSFWGAIGGAIKGAAKGMILGPMGAQLGAVSGAASSAAPGQVDPNQQAAQAQQAATEFYRNQGSPVGFQAGLAQGDQLAQKYLGAGAIQGIQAERPQEMRDYLGQLKNNSNGYTPEELAAFQRSMQTQADQNASSTMRDLRGGLAGTGVRGGAASAQRFAALANRGNELAAGNRDILINNVAAKRQGLAAYGDAMTKQEATEMGQLKDRAAVGLGIADMGNQNAAAIQAQADNARAAAVNSIANTRSKFLGIF